VAAVALSACLKEVPLRLVSGNQARAQASEAEGAAAPVDAAAESANTIRASAASNVTAVVSGDDTTAAQTDDQ
jgi:hypothetical protein